MGTHEVIDLFEKYFSTWPVTKFCKVCLKSEDEVPLVEPKNFSTLLKNSTGAGNLFDSVHVCSVCEWRARAALRFLNAINFAVVAHRVFANLQKNRGVIPNIKEILKSKSMAPNVMAKSVVECEHMYQRSKKIVFRKTDTLVIDTSRPNVGAAGYLKKPEDSDVIVLDDDDPPPGAAWPSPAIATCQPLTMPGQQILQNIIPVITQNPNQSIMMPIIPMNLPVTDNPIIIQNDNPNMVPILVQTTDGNYTLQRMMNTQTNQINVNNLPPLNLNSLTNRIGPVVPVNEAMANNACKVQSTDPNKQATSGITEESRKLKVKPIDGLRSVISNIDSESESNVFTHSEDASTERSLVVIDSNDSNIRLIKGADGRYREVDPDDDSSMFVAEPSVYITKTTPDDVELIVPDKKRFKSDSNSGIDERLKKAGLRVVNNRLEVKDESSNDDVVLMLEPDGSEAAAPAEVHKQPLVSGSKIDWEDKIPMDLISFVDESETERWKKSGGTGLGIVADVRSEKNRQSRF